MIMVSVNKAKDAVTTLILAGADPDKLGAVWYDIEQRPIIPCSECGTKYYVKRGGGVICGGICGCLENVCECGLCTQGTER